MEIFSQKPCQSRDILLTTVYDHRNSRTSSAEAPEFSFLVETLPSKPDEEEDIAQHIFRLQKLNETILENMEEVDMKIKKNLAKRGRLEFLKINDKQFPFTNESLNYKNSIGNPTEFSEVQKDASIFEIDQNNNYFKYHEKSVIKHITPTEYSITTRQTKSKKKIPKLKPHPTTQPITHQPPPRTSHQRRRVYESVLSKFSTATLLKMNSQQL